jgi:hypothetical protein
MLSVQSDQSLSWVCISSELGKLCSSGPGFEPSTKRQLPVFYAILLCLHVKP